MYQIINYLQNICQRYLFQKKIILVPSYLDGNILKKSLSLGGFSALNLHIATLFDIARELFLPILLQNDYTILDSTLGQLLIFDILRKLAKEDKMSYFKLPFISPLLARSIFRTIKEIRVSGFSTKNITQGFLVNFPEMKDLLLVMQNYEQELKERKLIDEAELYSKAEKLTLKEDKVLFLVPHNQPMNELEQSFFNKLIKPQALFFQFGPANVLSEPAYLPQKTNQNNPELLAEKVYQLLNSREEINYQELPQLNLEFRKTFGEYNETKEVIRTIIKEGYTFDEVQIFYTIQEPYSQYFYQLSQLYHIPITFHSGINIKNSHPAQFLFSLLDWISDNHSVAKLIPLINISMREGNLQDSLLYSKLTSLLRESPIGWGRDRYIPGLKLAIEERKSRIANTSLEKEREIQEEIQYLLMIKDWVEKIFIELPDQDFSYPISLSHLAAGLARIVKKYAPQKNDNDQESAQIIEQKFGLLEKNVVGKFNMNEALLLIKSIIEQERINCSPPLPGHLHIASYKKGIWLNRSHTFLVGMDYQKFPETSENDTIFWELEKGLIKNLLSGTQRNQMEELRLLQLLFSQKGKIFLSFSCFDTSQLREQAPTKLMLQLYRLHHKNIFLDYSTFSQSISPVKDFIPQSSLEILDDGEFFLYFTKREHRDLRLLFTRKYRDFQEGVKAEKIRREEGFNAYNGRIKVNEQKVDPRKNRGIVLSASKLERIAFCPYLYFLIDILKIKPPKEIIYDPTTWLSPLERGLFLHQIYEKFYRTLLRDSMGEKIIPSFSQHWSLLTEIIEESLAEKRRYLAPPGELIFEAEKSQIFESAQIFLTAEEENYQGQFPQFLELAFGTRDNQHEIFGKIKAIELELPDGSRISIQGKIDRVDLLPCGTFRIIDYKTGSSKDYKKSNPFRCGKQIQHSLYSIALEKILSRKKVILSEVSESGYYFPTVAGQGDLILYEQTNKGQVLEIIKILLDIVAKGNFAMIQKSDELMCLDYKDILEQNELINISKKAKKDQYLNEPALEDLRRLQQFV